MDKRSLDAMLRYLQNASAERPKLIVDDRGNSELHQQLISLKEEEMQIMVDERPQCLFMLN